MVWPFDKKCPKCKSTNVRKITETDEFTNYTCLNPNCKNYWEEPKKKKGGKEEGGIPGADISIGGFVLNRNTKAIIIAVLTGLFVFTYAGMNLVKSSLMAVTGIFLPYIADVWSSVYLVLMLLLIFVMWFIVYKTNSAILGAIILGSMVLLVIFLPTILVYVPKGALSSLSCTLQNAGNPNGIAACQIQQDVTQLESKKIGAYGVLKVSLDTEYTGNVVYGSGTDLNYDNYILPLVVENPSETNTIHNFAVLSSSMLQRSGVIETKDRIPLAHLKTSDNLCLDLDTCDIKPKEKRRITLNAMRIDYCDKITSPTKCQNYIDWGCVLDTTIDPPVCRFEDSRTTEMEALVTFSYDYAGEGKFDFIAADSEGALTAKLAGRGDPTSSDGPVDVIVTFVPKYYVLTGGEGSSANFMLIVKLSTGSGGIAKIGGEGKSPIIINRLTDGFVRASGSCAAPWGTLSLETTALDAAFKDTLDLTSGQTQLIPDLRTSHTYVCQYSLIPGMVDTDPDEEEAKVVPFVAKAEYTFNSIVTKTHITVERFYSQLD